MRVDSMIRLPEGIVKFEGELSKEEATMVIELGLNYLIRAGAFPAITAALESAQKEEEAAMGYSDEESEYSFPENMDKND